MSCVQSTDIFQDTEYYSLVSVPSLVSPGISRKGNSFATIINSPRSIPYIEYNALPGLQLYRRNSPNFYSNLLLKCNISFIPDRLNYKQRLVLGAKITNTSAAIWETPLSNQVKSWDLKKTLFGNMRDNEAEIFSLHNKINIADITYFFVEIDVKNFTFSLGYQNGNTTTYFTTNNFPSTNRSGQILFTLFDQPDNSIKMCAKFVGSSTLEIEHTIPNTTSIGSFGFFHDSLRGATLFTNFEVGTRSINNKFEFCSPPVKLYTIEFTYTDSLNSIVTEQYLQQLVDWINVAYKPLNIKFQITTFNKVDRSIFDLASNLFDVPVIGNADFAVVASPFSVHRCCCSIPTAIGCAYLGTQNVCQNRSWINLTLKGSDYDGTLLAHEIGHNLGATHSNNIMSSVISVSNKFDQLSSAQILNSVYEGACSNKAETVDDHPAYTSVVNIPPSPPPGTTTNNPYVPKPGEEIIESSGSVIVTKLSNGNVLVNGVLIKFNGVPVQQNNGTWRFVAAETINGVNTIVLVHSSGWVHLWRMDSSWNNLEVAEGWFEPGTPEFIQVENDFNVDIDLDGSPSDVSSLQFTKNLPTSIFLKDTDELQLEVNVQARNSANKIIPFVTTNNTYQWYTNRPYISMSGQIIRPSGFSRILTRSTTSPNIFSTKTWQSIDSNSFNEYKCIINTNNLSLESNTIKVYRRPSYTYLVVDSINKTFIYSNQLPEFRIDLLPTSILNNISAIYELSSTGGRYVWINPQNPFSRVAGNLSRRLIPNRSYTILSIRPDEIKTLPGATLPYTIDFTPNYSAAAEAPQAATIENDIIPTYNYDSFWSINITQSPTSFLFDKQMTVPISDINNINKVNKIYTYINNQIYLYQKNYSFSNLKNLNANIVYNIELESEDPVELSYTVP